MGTFKVGDNVYGSVFQIPFKGEIIKVTKEYFGNSFENYKPHLEIPVVFVKFPEPKYISGMNRETLRIVLDNSPYVQIEKCQ